MGMGTGCVDTGYGYGYGYGLIKVASSTRLPIENSLRDLDPHHPTTTTATTTGSRIHLARCDLQHQHFFILYRFVYFSRPRST